MGRAKHRNDLQAECILDGHTKLRFAGSIAVSRAGNSVLLSSDTAILINDCSADLLKAFQLLQIGVSYNALQKLGTFRCSLRVLLDTLITLRFVVKDPGRKWIASLPANQVEYLSSHGVDADAAQMRISRAHVTILGLGGIGSVTLQHLVAAGISSFDLIDGDTVRLDNFNRQFIYSRDDIGALKVDAASRYISRVAPISEVTLHPQYIATPKAFRTLRLSKRTDILVIAADRPSNRIKDYAAVFCDEQRIPFICGSCGFNSGTWGPLIKVGGYGAYQRWQRNNSKLHADHTLGKFRNCDRVLSASFGPTNSVIAALMAKDIIHFIAGLPVFTFGAMAFIDFQTLKVRKERVTM